MGVEITERDKTYVDFLNSLLPAEEQVHFEKGAASGKGEEEYPEIEAIIDSLFPKKGRR